MEIEELVAEIEDIDRRLDKSNGAKNRLRNLKRRILSEGVVGEKSAQAT